MATLLATPSNVDMSFYAFTITKSLSWNGLFHFTSSALKLVSVFFLLNFWWRQLAAGRSLDWASSRGGWDERSCPRSATAIHSVAVDRTPDLPIWRWTLNHCHRFCVVSFRKHGTLIGWLIYPIWRSTKAYIKIVSKISGGGQLPGLPVPGCSPDKTNIIFIKRQKYCTYC